MVKFNALVAIGMVFSIQNFAQVDKYFACGSATKCDTHIFNVSVFKGVREFSQGRNKYTDLENIVNRSTGRGGGWEIQWSTNIVSFFYCSV